MKVCIVTSQYGNIWSGLGTYATNLINALTENGHDVHVICPKVDRSKAHPRVTLADTSSIQIAPSLGNWIQLSFLFNKIIVDLVNKESFDIIHFTDARESLFCGIGKTPVIGTMNDYYFIEAPRNPFYYKKNYTDWIKRWAFYNVSHFFEKRAIRKLSHIIANTMYVATSTATGYNVDSSRIKTIYYGLDIEKEKSGQSKNFLDGIPSILFVGANFQRKGLPTLIRAVSEVKKRYPRVMLYVVGHDSKQAAMEHLANETGIGQHIRFLGGLDNKEVRHLYYRTMIFAMPSMIEGFGIVFLEAMAAGAATIGCNCGGTPELIIDGENGFLVNPNDWKMLAQRIEWITVDESLRTKLREHGKNSFSRFPVETMLEETLALYREKCSSF